MRLTRSLVRQATSAPRPRSPLWRDRSTEREIRLLSIPFSPFRATAKRLGVSINDLFVAATASAVARYHESLDAPMSDARMAMPVNTRSDRSAAGNSFAPLRIRVRLDPDPVKQVALVTELLAEERADPLVSAVEQLAGVVNLVPAPLLVRAARGQTHAIDFVTSNLRAAPFELFVAGAKVTATYPVGPLAGAAFNLTLMSYNGQLDMGLHIDPAAVAEPDRLLAELESSFAELGAPGSTTAAATAESG